MSRPLKAFSTLLAAAVLSASVMARADAPGCTATGVIPAALPARLLIGIGANQTDTWPQKSGTKWDAQWMYLSGQAGNNWYNGFTYSPADGSWIDGLFATIDGYGFIPGIHLYNMGYGHDGSPGHPFAGILTEIQQAAWTKQYFTEFKALMQRAKTFGKPVIVVLEGDSFGFLENLTNNDPTAMAAVASTGLPELANLPNTVAGFGMAYLAMRKSVGANNVALGPDTPYYAAQGDIMNFAPADMDNLQPHVDFQWKFFGPLGVGTNATGATFDFTASCPGAADCAAYTDGRPCWDPSDTASANMPSINRYLQWLHLFNQTSGVRWMLHQVAFGNSQHRNVPYDGTARSGYKDNKAEYLFQFESPASPMIRDQHLANFANAGVIGILFGFSDDGDTPTTDLWTDNQPFLKTHVAAVNNTGGFGVARSATGCGDGGSGSGGVDGGSPSDSGADSLGSVGSSSGGSSGVGSSSGGLSSSSGSSGYSGSSGAGSGSGSDGSTTGSSGGGGSTGAANAPFGSSRSSGCGCSLAGATSANSGMMALLLVSSALRLRRRRS
jgi:MYXO-CTERM domain-containing protein